MDDYLLGHAGLDDGGAALDNEGVSKGLRDHLQGRWPRRPRALTSGALNTFPTSIVARPGDSSG